MNKTKLEVIRINEDVIATSGYACANKYHLIIQVASNDAVEQCFLFSEDGNNNLSDSYITSKPAALSGATGSFSGNYYCVELSPGKENDMFYWNGSSWVECTNDKHPR